MTRIPTWGHDPGRVDGALVLLGERQELLVAVSWHLLQRKGGDVWRVEVLLHGRRLDPAEVASLHGVGQLALACGLIYAERWRLVTEGLFVRGGRTNGVLTLAEAAGEVVGPLRDGQVEEARPLWSEWTAQVLGRPGRRIGAAQVGRLGRQVALARWPELGALAEVDHVVDAALMATWTGRGR